MKNAFDKSEKDEIIKHAKSRDEAELKERKIEAYREVLRRRKELRLFVEQRTKDMDALEDKIFTANSLGEVPHTDGRFAHTVSF